MKKYFAAFLAFLVVAAAFFTACNKNGSKSKNGAVFTDDAGKNYLAPTDANGGIIRNENGDLIVLATDAKGKNVKDENGEYMTEAVTLERALVVGNRIERRDFSLETPSGWSVAASYPEIVLKKDGSEDSIKLTSREGISFEDLQKQNSAAIDALKDYRPGSATKNEGLKIRGADAAFVSAFVPGEGEEASAYLGFILFSLDGALFNCILISDRDMGASTDEIVGVLESIEVK